MSKHQTQHDDTISLTNLLGNFVREAEHNFPNLRNRVVLYNVRRQHYYTAKGFRANAKGFKDHADFQDYLANHPIAHAARDTGDAISAFAVRDTSHRLSLIFFNEKVQNKELPGLGLERAQALLLTLDHELAHLVIPEAYNIKDDSIHGGLIEENTAEAFAQLMHYKRFGTTTDIGRNNALDLARTLVFHDSDAQTHFYYPTIRQIVARRDQIDFNALTPADIAALARRFAITYTPSDAQVTDIDKAFASCRKAYRHGGMVAGMRELARTTEAATQPHIARLGVDLFLDLTSENGIGLQGAEWAALRHRIKLLDMRLAKEDILFGVPTAPTPKAARKAPRP